MARELADRIDGVAYHWYQALESTFENSKPESPLDLPSWIEPESRRWSGRTGGVRGAERSIAVVNVGR